MFSCTLLNEIYIISLLSKQLYPPGENNFFFKNKLKEALKSFSNIHHVCECEFRTTHWLIDQLNSSEKFLLHLNYNDVRPEVECVLAMVTSTLI